MPARRGACSTRGISSAAGTGSSRSALPERATLRAVDANRSTGTGVSWRDLDPDPAMEEALDFADAEVSREAIHREFERIRSMADENQRRRERPVLREMRKRWSERFATACATMLAAEVRSHPVIGRHHMVLPDEHGRGQETFTPLGHAKGKRIDVVVTGPLVGLQVGISLKGLNSADDQSGNHDKNLTGRLYELRDEVSTVHDHLPRAFMAALFFMPVAGCADKSGAPSSFAHLVAELRARTGRLDPSIAAQAWRCDYAAVGLYVPGDPRDRAAGLRRGVVRYFPVLIDGTPNPPPRRGAPQLEATYDRPGVIDRVLDAVLTGSAVSPIYGDPERGLELHLAGSADDEPQPGHAREGSVDDVVGE